MGTEMFVLMDVLVVGAGIYFLYCWYLLWFKKEVKEGVLLSKEYPFKKCKDKEGYTRYVAPRLLVLGIVSIMVGIIGLLNDRYQFLGSWYLLVSVAFFLIIIWFALIVKKSYKLFW